MLHDVRERLACDEVRSRLDLGREALLRRVDRDGQRRAGGELLERVREATLREDPRVDALRELAQLLDRDLKLVRRRREQPLDVRVARIPELALRAAKLER